MGTLQTIMFEFFGRGGPFTIVQTLLVLVILLLVLINVVRLSRAGAPRAGLGKSIDAILFWGAITAVLGFMGTWSGLLKSVAAMARHGLVNPQALFMGISEMHITTAFGLGVLLLSGFVWCGLKLWIESKEATAS